MFNGSRSLKLLCEKEEKLETFIYVLYNTGLETQP